MFLFLTEETDNSQRSAERIAYLEGKYGIVFPDILKRLYAQAGSSEIKPCEVRIGGRSYIPTNLVLPEDEDLDFEFAADDDRDEPLCRYIPQDWYPLAYDGGGNFFYWSDRTHQVFFVDHEEIETKVLIAESIEAFIELLNRSAAAE